MKSKTTGSRDVKTNLLDHSEVKVCLLGEYLKRYLGILTNVGYNERIRVYDVFCGEGLYSNGGHGSPLVILDAIRSLHESGVVARSLPPIDCYFNDVDTAKVAKLKQAIGDKQLHKPEFGNIEFTSLDYMEKVKEVMGVLKELKHEKVFVFIDPYDYKHIRAKDIKALLEHRNAEVLLWQPTQFMYRFEKNDGTPPALKSFIEEFKPYDDWIKSNNVWLFIEKLKEAFRNYLGDDYFVDTFTIEKDAKTVFCMYFFSSHIRGFEKMLEAKWDIDNEEGKGWEYTGQPDLFAMLTKTNVLEEKLRRFLNEPKTNAEVYCFVLHEGFLPTHTGDVLRALQNNGSLDVKLKDGMAARKNSFYISYDNYRDNPDKVKIKCK